MTVTLSDIKRQTGPLPGGIQNVYIANVSDINEFTESGGVVSADLVTSTGDTTVGFVKYEFDPDTAQLTFETVGEDGSKSFQPMVELRIGGDDTRLKEFENMINGPFLVITETAMGNMRILGNHRTPALAIQANYSSGAAQGDPNGTTIQFKARQGTNPPQYTGAIPMKA